MDGGHGDFKHEAERLEDPNESAIGELAEPPTLPVSIAGGVHDGVDLSPDTLIQQDAQKAFAVGEVVEPASLDRARRVGGVDLGEV